MNTCPNCGTQNDEDSRFCANCGASLTSGGRGATDPLPPLPTNDPSQLPPTSPEWRMSSAGPLPPPPRRPRWLWVLLGLFGACLLICVGIVIWSQTLGRGFVESIVATAEVSLTATAEAANPSLASPAIGTPVGAIGTPVSGIGAAGTPALRVIGDGTPVLDLPALNLGTPAAD